MGGQMPSPSPPLLAEAFELFTRARRVIGQHGIATEEDIPLQQTARTRIQWTHKLSTSMRQHRVQRVEQEHDPMRANKLEAQGRKEPDVPDESGGNIGRH